MRKSIPAVLAACAAMLAGLVLAPTASAASFPTTVTIRLVDRPGADLFRGRVTSPNNNCIEDRRIQLFRARAGDDQLIDIDDSEDNGAWDIDVEGGAAPGNYYVRALRSTTGGDVCRADRSPIVHVTG
jgi:hypothetical protein